MEMGMSHSWKWQWEGMWTDSVGMEEKERECGKPFPLISRWHAHHYHTAIILRYRSQKRGELRQGNNTFYNCRNVAVVIVNISTQNSTACRLRGGLQQLLPWQRGLLWSSSPAGTCLAWQLLLTPWWLPSLQRINSIVCNNKYCYTSSQNTWMRLAQTTSRDVR